MAAPVLAGGAWLLAGAASGQGAEAAGLAACAEIAAAPDRLACYDALAGRAPAAPPPATTIAPAHAPLPATPRAEPSLLSRYWELDDADKRGIFNFVGYRPNYVLPLHATTRINRAPVSPTQPAVPQPNYRHLEAKFQVSLRTKLAQDFGLKGADLWAAFTQQAMWQVWNSADSKPFRNTDYEPELIYVVPTAPGLRALPLGWQWRYTQLSLAHQSNGQSDPLSRSWNRVVLGAGVENPPWTLSARLNKRINEPRDSDNNPDLVGYRGRGELQLAWAGTRHTASITYRSTLKDVKYGALMFEWTYPLIDQHPNGLRWYVQVFNGYGEALTDYNFRQSSVGAGVSFLQF